MIKVITVPDVKGRITSKSFVNEYQKEMYYACQVYSPHDEYADDKGYVHFIGPCHKEIYQKHLFTKIKGCKSQKGIK